MNGNNNSNYNNHKQSEEIFPSWFGDTHAKIEMKRIYLFCIFDDYFFLIVVSSNVTRKQQNAANNCCCHSPWDNILFLINYIISLNSFDHHCSAYFSLYAIFVFILSSVLIQSFVFYFLEFLLIRDQIWWSISIIMEMEMLTLIHFN